MRDRLSGYSLFTDRAFYEFILFDFRLAGKYLKQRAPISVSEVIKLREHSGIARLHSTSFQVDSLNKQSERGETHFLAESRRTLVSDSNIGDSQESPQRQYQTVHAPDRNKPDASGNSFQKDFFNAENSTPELLMTEEQEEERDEGEELQLTCGQIDKVINHFYISLGEIWKYPPSLWLGVNPEQYWTEISKDRYEQTPVRCDGASIVLRVKQLYADALGNPNSCLVSMNTPCSEQAQTAFDGNHPVLVLEIKWKNTSYLHTTFELDCNLRHLSSYHVVNQYKSEHVCGEALPSSQSPDELRYTMKIGRILNIKRIDPSQIDQEISVVCKMRKYLEQTSDIAYGSFRDDPEKIYYCDKAGETRLDTSKHGVRQISGYLFLVQWQYQDASWEYLEDLELLFPDEIHAMWKEYDSVLTPVPHAQSRTQLIEFREQLSLKCTDIHRCNTNILYVHQLQGINMMLYNLCNQINILLADNVGFGKTIQVVQLINVLYQQYSVYGPHLIIAPTSTLGAWCTEIQKWFGGKVAILTGNAGSRRNVLRNQISNYNCNIVLTSPEVAIIEKAALNQIHWSLVCIDEAHTVKNRKALRTRVFRNFTKDHVILLTATPLANGVEELFSLLSFLNPQQMELVLQQVKNDDWKSNTSLINSILQQQECDTDNSTVEFLQLIRDIRPFIIRRVSLALPAINMHTEAFDMSDVQSEQYQNQLQTSGFRELSTLRKICTHPVLANHSTAQNEQVTFDLDTLCDRSLKFKRLVQIVNYQIQTRKQSIVVFVQFLETAHFLRYIFQDALHHSTFLLTGETAYVQRQQDIDAFTNREGASVYILTSRAGGQGINLQRASACVILEQDYNPQVDRQAVGRIRRLGQKADPIDVYILFCKDSIEEDIIRIARTKEIIADLIVGAVDQALLTDEQIESYLKSILKKRAEVTAQQ